MSTVPLASLCTQLRSGGTPKSDRADFYGGDIPFVTIEDMTATSKLIARTAKTLTPAGMEASNCWLVPSGAIIYSIYATLGVARLLAVPAATNQAILGIIPHQQRADAEFLFYCLAALEPDVSRLAGHTTQSNLSSAIVKALPIPNLPKPEQQQIARVLATIDRAIEQMEALLRKQQRIKAGLMHDLLTRGLDAQGRLRDPATHKFKQSRLGLLPIEWTVASLGVLARIGSGITLGNEPSGPDTVELPYLRVANVQDGFLDLSEIKTIRVFKSDVERFALKTGDVLMNEGGDFDKLGRGTVWRGEIVPCLHQNHVFCVRVDESRLIAEYLAAFSASALGKSYFVLNSKQSTNLASINSSQLKAFPIALPPVIEQRMIVGLLAGTDEQRDRSAAHLAKLRRLKIGLMQDLLTGRVPVTPLLA